MKLAVALFAIVFMAHYGYASFGDGSKQAKIDWFYAIGGFKSAALFALLPFLIYRLWPRKAAIVASLPCGWGVAEELQVGVCQVIALQMDKYPDVKPEQGLCGALTGTDTAAFTALFIVGFLAWVLYARP